MSKVLLYPERTWIDFDSERWDVSTELVKQRAMGSDDIDPDTDIEYVHDPKATKAAAIVAAGKLLKHPRIAYGAVRLQCQRVDWLIKEDRIAEWIDVGDSEEFCADDFRSQSCVK
jgi:hypothetical protein